DDSSIVLRPASERHHADAEITADARAWHSVARDLAGGLDAHRAGRLVVRRDMHLGVGFLAATSGLTGEGRLRFARVRTRYGRMATMEAGTGRPLVALHGLGGTKISFLPTLAALAPERRVIAVDLPGFGDSDKPLASYDAAFSARWIEALLDALDIDRADILGHSMGGRVALELGIDRPDRVRSLMLMTPSLFLWGRRDQLVPIGFARHVAEALPSAEHVELDCGHIPQFERPAQAHAAMAAFLRRAPLHGKRFRAGGQRAGHRRAASGRG